MKEEIYGLYNEYHYTVNSGDKELYEAGNSPYDSQTYVTDLENYDVVPIETMKEYCEQTCKNIAEERNAKFVGVQYDELEEV